MQETNCDTFDLISRTKAAPSKTWTDHSKDIDDPALQSAIASGIVSFVSDDRDPELLLQPSGDRHPVHSCSEDIFDYEDLLS